MNAPAIALAIVTALLLVGIGDQRADAAAACEAARLRLAGDLGRCRLRAEARRATVRADSLRRCTARFARRWDHNDRRLGALCLSAPSTAEVDVFVERHTTEVVAGLSTGDLSTCPAALAACEGALTGCLDTCPDPVPGALTASGQVACWDEVGTVVPCEGSGQDGEHRLGLPRAYLDTGDGTISDARTGLMWEKLGDDGGVHDVDTLYTWDEAFAKVTALNQMAFAGYDDWRLPNIIELKSLVDLRRINPAIDPLFDVACVPGCGIDACSCTALDFYWSSTTYPDETRIAYNVAFSTGRPLARYKSISSWRVRAVRGGG